MSWREERRSEWAWAEWDREIIGHKMWVQCVMMGRLYFISVQDRAAKGF